MTERNQSVIGDAPASFEQALVTCGRGPVEPERVRLVSSALLAALRGTGTAHLYADTADSEELRRVVAVTGGGILAEIDGNTVNQPLARRVLDRYLTGDRLASCARELRRHRRGGPAAALLPYLYTVVSGWIGNDLANAFAAGRPWQVSLQLHMGALTDSETAKALGRTLRSIVPSCFVKVPFRPHEPQSLLIARDLEAKGIPVNFTSTLSTRQVVAAALLANVTRTNIFMGRLNQSFRAARLGEHVALEAQRALRHLRRQAGVKTQLIVASMREWRTFVRLAGCDVFTAPCEVLGEFLGQSDVPPEGLTSQLETSYEDRVGIADDAIRAVGQERIARLWRVEPEFVEFLMDYRASAEYRRLGNGERLRRRFEDAGFGDFFRAPGVHEWQILRKSKLLDLAAPPAGHLAADTHMSLLADGDFVNQQEAIDAALLERVAEETDQVTAIRDGDVRRLGVVGVPRDEAVRSDHEDRAHDGNSSHLRLNRLPGEDRVEVESGP
jgi:transaldolase